MEFKMPQRIENSHKGTYGRVLNISGSDYMPGAAILSSLSALTIGCGYVILCSTERVINAAAAQTQNVVFAPLADLSKEILKADVILIGCGLSTSDEARGIFIKTLNYATTMNITCIIDADGLNILSTLSKGSMPENTILTPHPKEAARLLDCDVEDILCDTEKAAKEISARYNSVTVLKSHNTVVCSKTKEIYINNTGGNCLAKAGSGDVLAGIIAGLSAQKCEPFEAAALGVYLHGLAGDLAKNDLTEYGVLAHNQVRYIPDAVKTLL